MDIVLDFGGAQGDENIIVAMMMHQRICVRCDLNLEHAYKWILQHEMMVRFGGDLDFARLRRQQDRTTDY